MKTRRFLLWILALVLLLTVPMAAFAAADDSDAKLRYVTDASNLLTEEQEAALEARAQEISQEYEFSVYIIALDDYRVYSTQSDFWDASVEIYESYDLGWGEEKAGAFLMLSMQERDFCLHFNSDRADYAFTEAGRDKIEDRVVPYLRENDYYGGFNEYLNCCQEYSGGCPKREPHRGRGAQPERKRPGCGYRGEHCVLLSAGTVCGRGDGGGSDCSHALRRDQKPSG